MIDTPLRSAEAEALPIPALIATGLVQVIAALMINAMPAIVGALTQLGRLDPEMAGYVVGVDLAAQVAGTLLFLSVGRRVSWSSAIAVGIALMVAGNLLSCVSRSTAELLATRLIAGIGAGIVRSACFVAFSRAPNPARAIASLNVAQIISSAAAFATFPWLTRSVGWFGPYLALSVMGALTFASAPWWPRLGRPQSAAAWSFTFGRAGTLCLLAVFLYFLAQAAVWAFAEAIGSGAGQSAAEVTSALEFSAFAGIAAAVFVFAISKRLSTTQSLMVGLGFTLAGLFLLTLKSGFWPFAAGIGLFNFAWNATTPFQFSTAAAADGSGNTAAAFSAADGLGLAAGPAIAGVMIALHREVTLNVLAAVCTLVSILMFASLNVRRAALTRR
jgi:predicted MFS family arabinose efflux permease